jgi:hypothetical protein
MAAQRLMKKTTPPLTREGVVQVISYVSRKPKFAHSMPTLIQVKNLPLYKQELFNYVNFDNVN